ncbi:MAG: RES family NAD+ phosphorylase [Bacteroidia bacterium]
MIVYRIGFQKFIKDISGTGAELHGGRWNPKGYRALYTSQTVGTSAMEYLVNLDAKLTGLKLALAVIEIPDNSIITIGENDLPANWKSYPANESLSLIGKKWLDEKETLVLSVPSSVILLERNFLINPKHELFNKVKIKSTHIYEINERIAKKLKL